MVMKVKVVNVQQQATTTALVNGNSLAVRDADTIRLLSKESFQTTRKGNDLIIKNAKGEEFVLKDYYVKVQNVDEKQLLAWDDELNSGKEIFGTDLPENITLAEADTGVVNDASSGGQGVANSGGAGAAGAGGVSTGMALGMGALALGGVAVASSSSGGSGNSSAQIIADVNKAPVFTSDDSVTTAENTTGVVYQAQASDSDGDKITYSLSGADAVWFDIDANTGAVSFKNAPDYEVLRMKGGWETVWRNPEGEIQFGSPDDIPSTLGQDNTYSINVIASDRELSTEKSVTITVTDVYESSDLVLLGQPVYGTEGNDTFNGTTDIDYIYGFSGDDEFNSSPGWDILIGGAGRDTFNFEPGWLEGEGGIFLAFDPNSIDTIMDFVSGVDIIGVASMFIQDSPELRLNENMLVQGPGAVALEANDWFIFDSNNGALYFDSDGSGPVAAQQFATLYGVTSLAASDIVTYASDVIL